MTHLYTRKNPQPSAWREHIHGDLLPADEPHPVAGAFIITGMALGVMLSFFAIVGASHWGGL